MAISVAKLLKDRGKLSILVIKTFRSVNMNPIGTGHALLVNKLVTMITKIVGLELLLEQLPQDFI